MIGEIRVGQRVRAFKKPWTPDGWEPIEELATVVSPCVPSGSDYAGDVELKLDGVLHHVFVQRVSIEPVDVGDAIQGAVLEMAAIAVEALEQSDRKLVPDSLWASVKNDRGPVHSRIEGGLIVGLDPRRHRDDAGPSVHELKFPYPMTCEKRRHPLVHEAPSLRRRMRNPQREWTDHRLIPGDRNRRAGCHD